MRKMKDSGVAWIGEMPEDWTVKRGKFTLKLLNRPVKETDDVITCFRDGEVTLRTNRRTDGFTVSVKEIGYQGIEPGDLVIHGMDGFAGSIGISDSRGKSSPVLVVCDTDENKRYIMYYLRSMAYNDVFTALATGIRVRSCDLRWNKLAELPYILPSLEEQNQIVLAIESSTSKVDALIANVQAQIEKLKAYKQSLITEVVTKGLDPNAPMKDSRVDVYPYMPAHWNVQKTLTVLSMPITDGPHTTPELISDGIPFVSAEAVSCGNGKIDFSHIRGYISEEFYNECCKKYIPKLYDIYMIKSGATTGKVSIVDTDRVFTIWSPLAVFRCDPNVGYFKFIFYFLQSSAYQRQVQFGWTYGTQQNIGMRTLERLKIFVPPYNEQVQIAEYLDNKCVQIDQLISIKQSKIEKLEQYKRSLIYEYVTGKKEVS